MRERPEVPCGHIDPVVEKLVSFDPAVFVDSMVYQIDENDAWSDPSMLQRSSSALEHGNEQSWSIAILYRNLACQSARISNSIKRVLLMGKSSTGRLYKLENDNRSQ